MDQQTVTLIAAIVAALVSIIGIFVNSRNTQNREKFIVVWKKQVDRIFEIEELGGTLVEQMGSYQNIERLREKILEPMDKLELFAGRLARYPTIRQSARELHHNLACLFALRRDHQDDRDQRSAIELSYKKLLQACDDVLKSGH